MAHSYLFKSVITVSLLYSTYTIGYRAFAEALHFIWLPIMKTEDSDNGDKCPPPPIIARLHQNWKNIFLK